MTYKSKFYWDEETLNAFKFEANYVSYAKLLNSVESYVENCCQLEDGETEDELVQDLIHQILKK